MKRGNHITEWLGGAGLAIAVAILFSCLPPPSFAQPSPQQGPFHPPRQWRQARVYQAQVQRPAPPPRQQPARPRPRGHAGDWLRRYKDLPPADQERELQNDPEFHRLPPERQQQLRQRLQRFSTLPPQQQLRVLNRMETWEHLTPEQKKEARQVFGKMQQLPPNRRRMVHTAIDDLRQMPPEQREKVINSERFKGMFSDQERDLMRESTHLPLAPADSGDIGPQEPD